MSCTTVSAVPTYTPEVAPAVLSAEDGTPIVTESGQEVQVEF